MMDTHDLQNIKTLINGILNNKNIQKREIGHSYEGKYNVISADDIDWEDVMRCTGLYRVEPEKEGENDNVHIANYEFEELDNGVVIRDLNEGYKAAALYGNMEEMPSKWNRNDVIMMLGKILYDEVQAYQNLQIANKVKITIKLEEAQ